MHRDWSPLCVCPVESHSQLGVVPVAVRARDGSTL